MAWTLSPACADVKVLDRETAEVEVTPKRKKIAIIGFATNSLMGVPWHDPEFELWSMNQGHLQCQRRTDRHFEMHVPEAVPDIRDPNYMKWLKDLTIPVYMIGTYEYAPTSVRYPIERAIAYMKSSDSDGDYFMSSVAYMMVLAALEGFEEIHLYGINLAIGDEYTYEKPNAEYIIAWLRAKGIRVFIPRASSLCKQYHRYGYHVDSRPMQHFKVLLDARENEYKSKIEKLQADGNVMVGAMREAASLKQIVEGMSVGADLVLAPPPEVPKVDLATIPVPVREFLAKLGITEPHIGQVAEVANAMGVPWQTA